MRVPLWLHQKVKILFEIMISVLFVFSFVSNTQCAQQKQWLDHDLLSVSFPTEKDGWVCGRWGMVLHTSDGGQSWELQETGTNVELASICFVDAKNGWAVGDLGTILHTEDAGASWVKQDSPVDHVLMDVCFADAQNGWAVGEWTTVLSTQNGGKTWRIQFENGDFILQSVSFSDKQNGWAVGEFGFTYRTEDGGRNWKQQAGHYGLNEAGDDIVGGNFLFDVVAVDRLTAWAVGIDGYVTRTTDGGVNWQELQTDIPKVHLFGLAFDGKGRITICGSGLLVSSSDGGTTFKTATVDPPITYGWLYQVVPRGKGFVAVGGHGGIFMSDDKGISWNRVNGGL